MILVAPIFVCLESCGGMEGGMYGWMEGGR